MHDHIINQVNRFSVLSTTSTTATLSWSPPNGEVKYYIVRLTNVETSMSEEHYIADRTTTSIVINSLHPNHRYQFSIAAFTVALGPFVSQIVQLFQDGKYYVTALS